MNSFSRLPSVSVFACTLLALPGCQTLRGGGAPEPSFDLETDLRALDEEFRTTTSIKDYYAISDTDQKVAARNRFVMGRIVQIDLRYIDFIRTMTNDRQQLDAATDLATFTINVAGTLVGGVRSGKNLAAAAAVIGGTRETVVKDFYYEKSMDALVGTMNARRKEVLVSILAGLKAGSIEQYPFELALTQLHEYYMAGTLNGALRFINTTSAEKEKSSEAKIQELAVLPASNPVITNYVLALGEAIRNMDDAGIEAATRALGGDALAAGKPEDRRRALKARLDAIVEDTTKNERQREAALEAMLAAFGETDEQ
ncbi:MAG: hypothetical protein AB1807_25430 [Pseudomonadota bacterium]